MGELELNYGSMQECINSIKLLTSEYPTKARPSVSGEGLTITELEQMADLYDSFYETMEILAEETAKYLERVVTDFKNKDEKRVRN